MGNNVNTWPNYKSISILITASLADYILCQSAIDMQTNWPKPLNIYTFLFHCTDLCELWCTMYDVHHVHVHFHSTVEYSFIVRAEWFCYDYRSVLSAHCCYDGLVWRCKISLFFSFYSRHHMDFFFCLRKRLL